MSVADTGKVPGPFSGWSGLPTKIIVTDLFERAFVLGLFVYFLSNMLGKGSGSILIITILLIFSETLPLVLIWSRGPSATMSQRPSDWLLGFAGATAPLLVIAPQTAPLLPLPICIGLMIAGLSIQVMSKFFLGRSFGIVAANRGIKVAGPYRIVRHPIYAGYTLTHIAFLLAQPCWQNLVIYAVGLSLQIMRIMREEQVLRQDPGYVAYAGEVRYRLLPGVF